jgi:tetratricopeptide (TPR) repeat protein
VWVERLEGEHDNMREALSWLLERREAKLALRFGGAFWRFWFDGGYLSEGVRWLERILASSEPVASPVRVKALEGMGWQLQSQGDYERAEAPYEEMLKLSKELGDKGNVATALNSLGTVAAQQGDNERARALLQENLQVLTELEEEGSTSTMLKKFHALNLLGYLAINEEGDYTGGATLWEESLALAREAGDALRVGTTLCNLGHVALLQGDYERARALSEEALAFAHELGSAGVGIIPVAVLNLGLATLGLGEYERAAASFEGTLVMSQHAGRKLQVIDTLEGKASLAGAWGEDTRAAHLWGAAEAAREVTGIALSAGERALHEPYLAAARSRLGEAAWEEALGKGRAITLKEAAEYALAKEAEPAAPTYPALEEPSTDQPPVALTPARTKWRSLWPRSSLTVRSPRS